MILTVNIITDLIYLGCFVGGWQPIDSIDSEVKQGPILGYISYEWLGRGSKKSLNIKTYKKIVLAEQWANGSRGNGPINKLANGLMD